MTALTIRPALVADAGRILALVNAEAMRQTMLPRSPASVIERIRDFVVAEADGRFVGCGALTVVWDDLAEIRSLAVDPDARLGGTGRAIVSALVEDARRLGVARVFCFTYVPRFFATLGFEEVQHQDMPHKVFNDCVHCPKFYACDEIAMERWLDDPAAEGGLPSRPLARSLPLPRHTGPDGLPRRR